MCTSLAMHGEHFWFGRNMDIEDSFGERVVITPRCYPFVFRCGEISEDHYAMIGMAAVADGYPLYAEAVNEKGLGIVGLHFPGNAVYREKAEEGKRGISPFELIPYLLGRCASLSEARELLGEICLVSIPFSERLALTPLHWHIADRTGSLVLESTVDGMHLYENPVGVLTNNPPFPFHLANLCHYGNLTNRMPDGALSGVHGAAPFGMGFGAVGLPGDYSSTSRFVRAAYLLRVARAADEEELSHFFHLLGAVAPMGSAVLTADGRPHRTIYSCAVDGERGIYYYTTCENRQITAIQMHQEDIGGKGLAEYPLVRREQIFYAGRA